MPHTGRTLWCGTLTALVLVLPAVPSCKTLNSSSGGSSQELYQAAKSDYLAGRYASAAGKAGDYVRHHGRTDRGLEALRIRAQSRLQSGQYGAAALDFRTILDEARVPTLRCYAALGLGHAEFAMAHYEQALDTYQQARDAASEHDMACLEPVADDMLYAIGICLQNLGRWKEAETALYAVWKEHPDSRWSKLAEQRVFHDTFSVQMGAYKDLNRAEQHRQRLAAKGIGARIEVRRRGAGRPLFAVVAGHHKTLEEVLKARETVARNLGLRTDALRVATAMRSLD